MQGFFFCSLSFFFFKPRDSGVGSREVVCGAFLHVKQRCLAFCRVHGPSWPQVALNLQCHSLMRAYWGWHVDSYPSHRESRLNAGTQKPQTPVDPLNTPTPKHTRTLLPPPLVSDACMGLKSIKGFSLLIPAYLTLNVATVGAVSIRPSRQCVKVRFALLAFRRLLDSYKPQITPDSFIISLPPLTPLARYFQPIHFYNLLLWREQTRNRILEIPALCLSVLHTHTKKEKKSPGWFSFLVFGFLLFF